MNKRIKGIFLVLMMISLLLGGSPSVFATDDIDITHVANEDKTIYAGHDFPLVITVHNNTTESITLSGIEFEGSSSLHYVGDDADLVWNKEIEPNEEAPETFDFHYSDGRATDIKVIITYTDNEGEKTYPKRIAIPKIQPRDPPASGGETDKSKYKPLLVLHSADIPQGESGESISISLTITNYSDYEARQVRMTPQLAGVPGNPFEIDRMMIFEEVARINKQKPAQIEFRFTIDKFAKTGTYTLPIKLTYKNIYGSPYEETHEIFIKITNTNVPARLVVMGASSNPAEILPDQEFTVTFDLWNTGTLPAENVTTDLVSNEHFHVLENVTKQYLFELNALNNREITYSLQPKKGLETGTYPISLSLAHKDAASPEEYTMYIYVEGEEEEEDIDIITENITTPKGTVLTEQPFTVSMDLKNIGVTTAKDVKVTVESGEDILPQSLNVINIPEIGAGDSVPAVFSFIAGKNCESRSYPIQAVIEYKKGDETIKKEQYMGVLIESAEKETTLNTVPKIIISEYATEPGMVNAGENFTLNMTFLNTSKLKSVQNMKITLVVDESSEETGSVFTPVQSSNTFYIDNLEPGEASKKEMVMYTIPDAKAKTYVVKALFEYEYEEQEQIKQNNMEDVFGIPVVQPAKLETTDVIVSEPAFVGEPVYITAEFYNMGKVTLSNLMVKAEGDFDTKESNYFVGNFEMGRSDYYEAPVIPLAPGELQGVLIFTFEDAAGQSHRIEREFTVNAMESAPVMNPNFPGGDMMPGPDGRIPGMDGPQKPGFPVIPVAIGAGVVVLIVVLMIILKKRKKKKEMMFDEDI